MNSHSNIMNNKLNEANTPKARRHPRGFFKMDESWSKDKTTAYYQGARQKVLWPLLKSIVIAAIWHGLYSSTGYPKWLVTVICLIIVGTYQHVVAAVMGLKYMGPTDQACFVSNQNKYMNRS